jgi:hypothetical protein
MQCYLSSRNSSIEENDNDDHPLFHINTFMFSIQSEGSSFLGYVWHADRQLFNSQNGTSSHKT